jgi:hypothetical protein
MIKVNMAIKKPIAPIAVAAVLSDKLPDNHIPNAATKAVSNTIPGAILK